MDDIQDPDSDPMHLSLTEAVADMLRSRIIRGQLKPGQHVVERKLCAELAVSRTPLREALKLLRQDGLVEIARNRGARVTPYSADDAIDLFEVISALEGQAAARAAHRITEDELADLRHKHAEMARHHRDENLDAYFALNSEIHDAIVRIADNPMLAASRARLMPLAERGRYMAIFNRDRWNQSVEEHDGLMTALHRRDTDAAKAIWEQHLLNTGLSVGEALAADQADLAR
ncbi:MAG: GntR family transcriptional regulator [Pseudomonadota bacterium]